MLIRVGLPSGVVHEFPFSQGASVRDLEHAIVEAESVAETHRVRLIAAGKQLTDLDASLDSVISDGGFVHCAISEKPAPRPPRGERRRRRSRRLQQGQAFHMTTDQNGDITVYITGDVGRNGEAGEGGAESDTALSGDEAPGTDGDDDREAMAIGEAGSVLHTLSENGEVRIVIPSLTARGFDRLGLAPDEVAALRRQFRAARGQPEDEEADAEADIEMEEAWLSAALDEGVGSGGSADGDRDRGEPRRNSARRRRARRADGRILVANSAEGTNTDFLLGCICGYLLGVLVLALLLDKNISRRWRVGIVAGVATNCAFGILRSSLYVQPSSGGFPGR